MPRGPGLEEFATTLAPSVRTASSAAPSPNHCWLWAERPGGEQLFLHARLVGAGKKICRRNMQAHKPHLSLLARSGGKPSQALSSKLEPAASSKRKRPKKQQAPQQPARHQQRRRRHHHHHHHHHHHAHPHSLTNLHLQQQTHPSHHLHRHFHHHVHRLCMNLIASLIFNVVIFLHYRHVTSIAIESPLAPPR